MDIKSVRIEEIRSHWVRGDQFSKQNYNPYASGTERKAIRDFTDLFEYVDWLEAEVRDLESRLDDPMGEACEICGDRCEY